jgi:hypothetical protein
MTSKNSTDQKKAKETTNSLSTTLSAAEERALIEKKGREFDLTAPVSEEEFDDAIQALGSYLLFNTNWDISFSAGLPKSLPVISSVPMLCKADDCPYHEICPVMKAIGNDWALKDSIRGTKCRVEKEFAVRAFASVATDLDVKPEQTIDLLNTANLIRLMVYRQRLDWDLSINGLSIDPVTIIDSQDNVYREKKANPLLREIERVENLIDKAQKSLVASRKDRLSMAAALGKSEDVLKNIFTGKAFSKDFFDEEINNNTPALDYIYQKEDEENESEE